VPGLDELLSAFDFEPICFANMTQRNYDYMAHGGDSEFTLRRNREAFEWVDLIERPGVPPEAVDPSTEVLGIKLAYPIFIAPSTRQRDCHPDGDAGMYQGATAAGTPMILASGSSIPIQRVAEAATGPRWSQFYPIENLTTAREQLELFQTHGARAIVVTVDQQASNYERDLHDRNLGGVQLHGHVVDTQANQGREQVLDRIHLDGVAHQPGRVVDGANVIDLRRELETAEVRAPETNPRSCRSRTERQGHLATRMKSNACAGNAAAKRSLRVETCHVLEVRLASHIPAQKLAVNLEQLLDDQDIAATQSGRRQ